MNYIVKSLDYFIYNDVIYSKGTEIELTQYTYERYGITPTENNSVVFISYNPSDQTICCLVKGLSCISIPNSSVYIQGVSNPICRHNQSAFQSAKNNFVAKRKKPDVFNGWLWYIFIALFLLICQNGIFYLIIATLIFVNWLVSKYKD